MSTTGIAGLTLGGGIGWLGRTHGLSCDNLLSVDIVTADGQLRTASADENADLFWAVRGGGGNFGVVTSFEYRLHQVGPTVLAGLLVWPRPMARDVLRAFREFTEGAPENASAYAGLGTSPDGVPIVVVHRLPPRADRGGRGAVPAAALVRAARRGHDPTDAVHRRPADARRAQPAGQSRVLEIGDPARHRRRRARGDHRRRSDCPSPLSAALIEFYGGAINRVGVQDTAYPLRDATYALNAISAWTDPAQDEANIGWSRGLWEAMQPFSPGSVYVNFLGIGDEGDDRVKAAYGPNYARLAQIKADLRSDKPVPPEPQHQAVEMNSFTRPM